MVDKKEEATIPTGESSDNIGASTSEEAKTVSESEFTSMKGSLEAEALKLRERISKLEGDVANERTAKSSTESKIKELEGIQDKYNSLTNEHDTLKSAYGEQSKARLDDRRKLVSKTFNLELETLRDMDESQLQALEVTLPRMATKEVPQATGYGATSSGVGNDGLEGLNGRLKIARALENSS